MFGTLKKMVGGATKRMDGRTDLLEACAAAATLIAMADSEIEDSEVGALLDTIQANDKLGSAFTAAQIEQACEKQLSRAKGGFTGRRALMKEIEDVANKGDAEDCEVVMLVALDISMADGEMEEAEKAVLKKLAGVLKVNLEKLMA